MKSADTWIRAIRKNKKMSGVKVAKQLGISPQHYYDIELGQNTLSAENAVKLADIFQVELNYLLGRSPSAIVDKRLHELGMSKEELSLRTGLSITYLNDLDAALPIEEGYDEAIKSISDQLKIEPTVFRNTLNPSEHRGKIDTESDVDEFSRDAKELNNAAREDLDNEEILTLAAHQVGHEGKLTKEQMDQIKLAMKIALARNNK
ncbi:helix-turn-helix domain XRE family transcriptional regulator [Paenibacillus phage Wanderer]|uniref:Helix-turn-helix domain XRE family transcriptional regulator n=2 Tax=Wanderervirus wanderer TaxID=2845749 RepID=A0A345ARJ2_9CAUD|nr:helix-turn-helix domain XRE family transcriptional regulator [Paenibacillus phage Wanderer]AXF39446.1 helix-turn-helix domain XRE family transcriptional regulator [Paenibacillus phage Wanderer]AXF40329.1 helix-turn-helix domain XRE family transcriptional regulator [Paenibacillus phage LincolnB]